MPDNSPSQSHRDQAPQSVGVAVITVSDTRTLLDDLGGALIVQLLELAGHRVMARSIIIDQQERITEAVEAMLADPQVDAVLLTGGTGLAARDQTTEAVQRLFDAEVPGYGELFRMLSYQEIGPAAMLSRAVAGRVGRKLVLTMPGSPNGVRLAMDKLIVPELAHLVLHAGK
ncbi:MAG: molybdenum cofactor biosynthesis protein B [Pirellulaceae bacterium]